MLWELSLLFTTQDPTTGTEIGERFSVPVGTFPEILGDAEIDGVVIATPPATLCRTGEESSVLFGEKTEARQRIARRHNSGFQGRVVTQHIPEGSV